MRAAMAVFATLGAAAAFTFVLPEPTLSEFVVNLVGVAAVVTTAGLLGEIPFKGK